MADQNFADNVFIGGNLGVGTSATAAKLEVNSGSPDGSPIVGISTLGADEFMALSCGNQIDPNPRIAWKRGSLRLGTAAGLNLAGFSEMFRITDSGEVGIGTQNPQVKLHIEGGSAAALSGGGALTLGALSGDNLAIDDNGIMARNNLATSVLNLQSAGGNLTVHAGQPETSRFVVNDNGDVGLGISNPSAKLHIIGSVKGDQSGALRIDTGTGIVDIGPKDTQSSLFSTDRSRFLFNQEIRITGGQIGSDSGNLELRTAGTTRVTVKSSNGNVGIGGTTNPQDSLDLQGAIRFEGNASRRLTGELRGGHNALVLKGAWDELEVKGRVIDWSGSNLHIGYDQDHSANYIELGRKVGFIRMLSGGGTSETMRVTGGRVGIKTTSPSKTLDVSGTFAAKSASISGGVTAKSLQIDGGSTFGRIKAGRKRIGNSGSSLKNVSISFGTTFRNIPHVMVTARGGNHNDTFAVTTRYVSKSYCRVNVRRVDSASGWGQQLDLDWIAWEFPLIWRPVPIPGKVVLSKTR